MGLSQPELVRRVQKLLPKDKSYSQQAYQQLEIGKSQSSVFLDEICEVLEVPIRWIKSGIGEIPSPPGERAMREPSISPPPGLAAERGGVILEADVRSGAGGGGVRHTEHVVSDGNGNTFTAEGVAGEWSLPQPVMSGMLHASAQNIRVFEVIGDSMEPRLRSGDRVFVDLRLTHPNPEGIFVLWDGYSVVVKQLQIVRGSEPLKLRVISANQQYDAYEVLADDVNIIGRYIGRFTTD